MKRHPSGKKALLLHVETIRQLGTGDLAEVAGGSQSAALGCGGTTSHPSICKACVN